MIALNGEFPLRDMGTSSAVGNVSLARHRWYDVKEAFAPRLVEEAILGGRVPEGGRVLEPFSGSGTVAVTAAMKGFRAEATEVNPFLHFVSSAKVQSVSPLTVTRAQDKVAAALKRPKVSPLEGVSTFSEGNRWNRWLFPTAVLRAFEATYAVAEVIENPAARKVLKLSLIGAAMDCCNAERDGKCLRYRKMWRDKQASASDFAERWQVRISAIKEDLVEAPLRNADVRIDRGDARRLLKTTRRQFDLCVTSPPYLNSFDYSDIYRPEAFLGRFVASNQELMRVRLATVRSHVQAAWPNPEKEDFGAVYEKCMKSLIASSEGMWSSRLPSMVQGYFEDMDGIMRALRRRATEDASLWIVVSTSAYAGIEIPVDLVLAEVAQRGGWYLREIGVLRYLRSSGQQMDSLSAEGNNSVPLRESVVILSARPH